MFRKILYPTDFSDVAQQALDYVIRLRGAGADHVVLLTVINDKNMECICKGLSLVGKQSPEYVEQARRFLQEEALKEAKPVEAELKAAGFHVDVRIESGVAKTKILDIAETENVSAIVLGSHGRSNVNSVLLGSVSDHIIRHSKRPVIVVKRDSFPH
jgi:nucleotide-binding universal stress UspA family protein